METELHKIEEEQVQPVSNKEVFEYSYQPVDENNRPLGAKQVFKGTTAEEVLDKVAKAHQESIKLNRQLNKDIRLGKPSQDQIPEDAQRFSDGDVDFKPRVLTVEERTQLSRDILDPEKFDEASDTLFEAKLGAKPQQVVTTLRQAQEDIAAIRAKTEAELFVKSNPDYYVCMENFETLTNWMLKNNLKPIKQNFQLAYNTLKEVGLLFEAPIVREEPVVVQPTQVTPSNSQTVTATDSRITNPEPSQTKRPPVVPTGLNRDMVSNPTPPVKTGGKLTVAEIERMPSEVYKKRLLTERGFKEAVDEAYATASQQ